MSSLATVALVAVTSLVAVVVGTRAWRLPVGGLRDAACRAAEMLGCAAVFFSLNVLAWIAAVTIARVAFASFVSMYLFNGLTIGALSLVQGAIFQRWWEMSALGRVAEASRSAERPR